MNNNPQIQEILQILGYFCLICGILSCFVAITLLFCWKKPHTVKDEIKETPPPKKQDFSNLYLLPKQD